ncbi:MAG: type I-E CRISPR-associated protein Cse1/CasA, partial [Desulfobacteraceae bacterium]
MNLINDPWIPVVMAGGERVKFSLAETLIQSSEIADLAVTPVQRVALMRLFICVIQAALNGPEDTMAWLNCKDRIVPESLSYLDRWKGKFELWGSSPFMQIPDLTIDDGNEKTLDMLDCCLSSGNNAALFDQKARPSGRIFDDAKIALNLITFLNFSTGGKVGQARWKNTKYSESTFAAPCIKCAHTFVLGDNLLDTFFFNLLCKKGAFGIEAFPNGKWGRPVWENFPKDVTDTNAFENAGRTYLGRLMPLSRFVKLKDKRCCIIGPTHKAYKIEHLPNFKEPSTTTKINAKTNDHFYLSLSSE